jgi:hypothetical protein
MSSYKAFNYFMKIHKAFLENPDIDLEIKLRLAFSVGRRAEREKLVKHLLDK